MKTVQYDLIVLTTEIHGKSFVLQIFKSWTWTSFIVLSTEIHD